MLILILIIVVAFIFRDRIKIPAFPQMLPTFSHGMTWINPRGERVYITDLSRGEIFITHMVHYSGKFHNRYEIFFSEQEFMHWLKKHNFTRRK